MLCLVYLYETSQSTCMVLLFLTFFIQLEQNYSSGTSLLFQHSISIGATLNADLSWSEWSKDSRRMEWWKRNGWALIEGSKPSMQRLMLQEHIQLDSSEFDPSLLSLEPDSLKHSVWDIGNNQLLVLYSLERCEKLFQRHIITRNK